MLSGTKEHISILGLEGTSNVLHQDSYYQGIEGDAPCDGTTTLVLPFNLLEGTRDFFKLLSNFYLKCIFNQIFSLTYLWSKS